MSSINHNQRQPLIKVVGKWPAILLVAMSLTTGALSLYIVLDKVRRTPPSIASNLPKSEPAITNVGALGRLEPPQGQVIHLSAPNALQGEQVKQLLVKEGQKVRVGQVVAILASHDLRVAGLKQAQKQVEVDQAHLAQVRAGAKAGDISAQRATIANLQAELSGQIATQKSTLARLEYELRNAQTDNQRYQDLYKNGAISASQADSKRLSVDTFLEQLNEAKATLNRTIATNRKQQSEAEAKLESIAEVRPTDVQAAQADVDKDLAAVQEAQAQLDL